MTYDIQMYLGVGLIMGIIMIVTMINLLLENRELRMENAELEYELEKYDEGLEKMKELGDNFYENHDIDEVKRVVNIDLSKEYQEEL